MAFTATVEPAFQNIRLNYDTPALTATVTISRTGPSNEVAAVRSWSKAPVSPSVQILARDWEAPIGVPLVYSVYAFNAAGGLIDAEGLTITVPAAGDCDTWLNDLARVNNTIRIVIEQIPELDYQIPTSVHEVIRRRVPIVSSDVAHTPSLEASVLTSTLDERDRARDALGNGVPVLLRTPPDLGVGNMYLAVLEFKEQRITNPGTVADRRFVITARQVDRPDPDLFAPVGGELYQDVKAAFATYQALKDGRANYDAVLYGWGGTVPDDVVPWPPTDV